MENSAVVSIYSIRFPLTVIIYAMLADRSKIVSTFFSRSLKLKKGIFGGKTYLRLLKNLLPYHIKLNIRDNSTTLSERIIFAAKHFSL